jgi:hypothetical protein
MVAAVVEMSWVLEYSRQDERGGETTVASDGAANVANDGRDGVDM